MEQHLLVHVRLVGVALGEQQFGGGSPEQLSGLTYRAEWDGGGAGELDVVVPDDRQLAGHVDAHRRHLLEQPESEQIVGAERRRGTTGAGESGQPLTCPTPFGDVERSRVEDEQRRRGSGLPSTLESVGDLHGRHRAADEGDALVPLLAQVGHGKDPALDIVDADTAEVGAAAAVDEHDGDAARGSTSSGDVSWSTGVTRTPRTRCCRSSSR